MVEFNLEMGQSHLALNLNDDQSLGVITGREVPPLDEEGIKTIIQEGIVAHAPENIAEKKIVIIIPDNTRLWARGDLYVPCIVEGLRALGVSFENICVLVALGSHAPMEASQKIQLTGSNFKGQLTIRNSAPLDAKRLVPVGTTSRGTHLSVTREAALADHVIIFGGVLHHLIAGFGGGRKYILPGIAAYESIQQNHSLAFTRKGLAHPGVGQAQIKENPVHLDMEEAAQLFLKDKTCTHVALAANGEGEIFHAQVGALDPTFTHACGALNRACCVRVPEKSDFALVSAGGHRTDG
ncbi:MAG: lactate racemase domain-containing protein, partial [Desulfovibrionales bacterium]|nr:lactate racemase domain-containing protein [Desulfovibrionales bacterium]